MNDALTAHDPLQRRSWATTLAQERDEFGCESPRGRDTSALSFDEPEGALDSAAESDRLLEHRVEHRCEVAGRGIDDLQYLGRRRLLLQRLARLGQKPRILHRNNRLRRKVLQ